MKVIIWLPILILAIFSNCADQVKKENNNVIDRKADEEAIHSLLVSNWTASSAKNAKGVVETFWPNGDGWIAGMDRVTVHSGLQQAEEDFGGLPGFQRYEGRIENIRFISTDAAIVETSATTVLDSGNFEEETTIVVARRDKKWRIAAWRVMTIDNELIKMLST